MLSLALALLLSAPSAAELRGALVALQAAQAGLASRTITHPADHVACVAPASTLTGTTTVRVGVALLSSGLETALGWTPLVDSSSATRPWVYAALEIQAVPDSSTGALPALPAWLQVLDSDEVETVSAATYSACEVAVFREGSASSPWRCACSTGTACTWTPPGVGGYGASTDAPKGTTLPPGTWSGTGCVPKPCVEWAGQTSMPAACQ